jgi:hypothetical protein
LYLCHYLQLREVEVLHQQCGGFEEFNLFTSPRWIRNLLPLSVQRNIPGKQPLSIKEAS